MRDNGLSAASYTSMGDISPEAAGPVLEALATAGIAAYAEPSGDGGADRLYVDAAAADRARPVIRRGTEEAQWRSIVEQFNAPSAEGHEESTVESAPSTPERTAILDDDGPAAVAADTDDPRDHFVPPEPEPGPRLDWISRLAWTGVLGGPVLLVIAALLDVSGDSRVTLAALVGFAGGFLTLVFRMKDRPNIDDTPDDGAVV
jgi:hypothetical protein